MTAYLMNKQNEQDTEGGGGVTIMKKRPWATLPTWLTVSKDK